MELPDPPLPQQLWAATPAAQAPIVALQQRIREREA